MIPTRDDILELAKNNIIVANCVAAWKAGACSWEQCLMVAVLSLTKSNDFMKEACIKADELRPVSFTIQRPKVPTPSKN
jgi:hypothetical protein